MEFAVQPPVDRLSININVLVRRADKTYLLATEERHLSFKFGFHPDVVGVVERDKLTVGQFDAGVSRSRGSPAYVTTVPDPWISM